MTGRFTIRRAWVLVPGALWIAQAPASNQASPYKITVADSIHYLNNNGLLAGDIWSADSPDIIYHSDPYVRFPAMYSTYPFFYDSNPGGKTILVGITSPSGGSPGSYDFKSDVISLNNRGQALGVDSQDRPIIFDTNTGQVTPISIPIGGPGTGKHYSMPIQIVDSGRIYGNQDVSWIGEATKYHPFTYQNGVAEDLGVPPGMLEAQFVAANNAGQVLVRAASSDRLFTHSFLLSNGTWTNLGNFQATGINDRGDIVGIAPAGPDSYGHTILLPSGGITPIDIGTLPGQTTVFPSSINDKGEIVGVAFTQDNTALYHAFLYRDGVMTDLNSLIGAGNGWTIRAGMSINDRGQILASADDGLKNHILLLTPDGLPTPRELDLPELAVPEPSTYIVFGALAAGLLWQRARA